jgi:ATP-binding cassette subfamily F protein 3
MRYRTHGLFFSLRTAARPWAPIHQFTNYQYTNLPIYRYTGTDMLQVNHLSKRYGDEVILDGVSFVVNPGDRVGLIGPNGCGKTTLFRCIIGQERPDSGNVALSPPDLRLGYLAQGLEYGPQDTIGDLLLDRSRRRQVAAEVARLAQAIATANGDEQTALFEAYSAALAELEALGDEVAAHQVQAVLAGLDLNDVPMDTPVDILSGGQKTRLGLARVLLAEPQLLLLDEPTNHLDIDALEWLEGWLARFRGAALIISHDRAFLDHTVSRVLDLDMVEHNLVEYVGNYSAYIEAWEKKQAKQWEQWRDQQYEIRRVKQDIARTRNQALSVELTTTPGQPGVRRLAKKVAKKAKARERKLDRYVESDERVERPHLAWQMKLEFADIPQSGQDVLTLEDVAMGFDEVTLFSGANQVLRQGERVALTGPNGAGKTTLLRLVTGELTPTAGRVRLGSNVRLGYYAQEQETLDESQNAFQTLRAVAPLGETEVRSFLHYFLFSGDDVFIPIGDLSYGERARLTLAMLVAQGCNLLLLDEPINHLDIPSRERFEQAMRAYEGTVVAVVHDRFFIERFATALWVVEGGSLRRYIDLDEWRRVRVQEAPA